MTTPAFFRFPNPVNETSVRLTASGVALMASSALAFRQPWLLGVLAYGFVARALAGPRLSPLALLVTRVLTPALQRQGHRPRYTPGPPKRFAQALGALVTVFAVVAYFALGWHTLAYALAALILALALLEAAVGLCVGCVLFRRLMQVGVVPAAVCAACADIRTRPG